MITAVNCGSSRFPEIVKSVELCGAECRKIDANDFLSLPDGTSGVIISGSPWLLAQKDSPLTRSMLFLKDTGIPVLGICFGHQVLGLMHGSSVFTGIPERSDVVPERIKEDPLFDGIDTTASFCADHTEGITLPLEFELLARSANYQVEAMKHKSKILYGVQFHPESSGAAGLRLIANFIDMCHKS